MIFFSRDQNTDAETLHGEIDLLGFGPCRIEWTDTNFVCVFERELTTDQQAQLAELVEAHDGSAVIVERVEREAKIFAIQDANKALVESAREKRLCGQQLTQAELAALVDAMLFPA